MAESIPPLRVRESDNSPNVIPVFDMILSGATLTDLGAGVVRVLVDSGGGGSSVVYAATGNPYITYDAAGDLTAERILRAGTGLTVASDTTSFYTSLVTPVAVTSGGTGASTFGAFGVLFGSGASAIQALGVMSGGTLLVGSGGNTRPHLLASGGAGQVLITSQGVVGNLAWVGTLGGAAGAVYAATGNQYVTIGLAADLTDEYTLASGTGTIVTSASNVVYVSNSAKVIRIPMALLTVQPDSSNAFWMATTLPLLDMAHVGFVDGGEGVATYWGLVPFNLHPDPNWNLAFYHMTNAGAGGNAIVTVRGAAVTHAESFAYSLVQSAGSYATQAATTLTISAVSSGSLDPVLTVASGDMLFVEVNRHGGNTNDTVGQQWNLLSLAADFNVL